MPELDEDLGVQGLSWREISDGRDSRSFVPNCRDEAMWVCYNAMNLQKDANELAMWRKWAQVQLTRPTQMNGNREVRSLSSDKGCQCSFSSATGSITQSCMPALPSHPNRGWLHEITMRRCENSGGNLFRCTRKVLPPSLTDMNHSKHDISFFHYNLMWIVQPASILPPSDVEIETIAAKRGAPPRALPPPSF